MLPVAILAGGLATRLWPITETIPKSLVEVAGRPFILRQLAYLRDQGVRRVVLCIGYLGEMIEEVVGTGELLGLEVTYSLDGPNLLGTGGALKKAAPLLGERFFVLYGDSFLPVNFRSVQDVFECSDRDALMTVLHNEDCWDKSNVRFQDGQLLEYNKRDPRKGMAHIDYGLGVLSAGALRGYPDGQVLDLADVYRDLSMQGRLAGMEVYQRFYEIGSHDGLKDAGAYFLNKE